MTCLLIFFNRSMIKLRLRACYFFVVPTANCFMPNYPSGFPPLRPSMGANVILNVTNLFTPGIRGNIITFCMSTASIVSPFSGKNMRVIHVLTARNICSLQMFFIIKTYLAWLYLTTDIVDQYIHFYLFLFIYLLLLIYLTSVVICSNARVAC